MTGARMSRSAQVNMFVAAVVGLAAAVVVLTLVLPARDLEWSWWGALILLLAARVAEAGIVEITRNSDEAGYGISLATVPQIVCALLLPAPIACLVAGASMLLDEYNHRSPAARLAFNVSSTMLSVGVAGIATNVLGISGAGLGIVGWTAVASLLGVAGSYYLANALPVACVGAIAGGRPIMPALVHSVRANALSEVAFALLGGLAAFVWVINPYWLLVGIVPAVISQLALRYVAERNRQAAQLASLDRLGQQLSASPTADGCFLSLIGSGAHFADGLASDEAEHALCRQLAANLVDSPEGIWVRDAAVELPDRQSGARTWLVLKLGRGDQVFGALGLVGGPDSAFTAHDRGFFALVAERVSLALESAQRSAELERMAFHDALTGLPNRELLGLRLEQVLSRPTDLGESAALLFLDLDRFKEINDTFGHRHGDLVLQEVGRRLLARLPTSATLARLAGDEFAVLLPSASAAEASRVADGLIRALAQTVQVQGVTLDVGVSIGVALAPDHANESDALLRHADVAMYVAKRRRGGYVVYSPDQDSHSRERLELAA